MRVHRPAAFACGLILGLCASSLAAAAEAGPESVPAAAVAKPAEASKSSEASKPAEASKSAEASKPADASKPAEIAAPADPALTPFGAVRALQALQDRIAHGSKAAQAAQARVLAHVADVFADADPAVWKQPRNAAAAALYLFSGGRAGVVRAVVEQDAPFTADSRRLVEGALAYSEGQDEIARRLLGSFDPKTLPPGVGGHLALVLATLLTDKDPARAGAMLDVARLLVPGSLVEEAALRRQIFLMADAATLDKFISLSRQYMRRFRGSVFASNFKGRLTSFAVRLAVAGDVTSLAKLDAAFSELPIGERRGLYLTLSRDAVLAGRAEAARYAAARAAALAPDAAETERARLYTAAAGAASDAAPTARSALSALDAARLTPRDAELRAAAVAVAESVDAGLGDLGGTVGHDAPPPDSSAAALIERAHRAMEAGDAILGAGTAVAAARLPSLAPPTAAVPPAAAPAGTTP